jgi:hypothetical protein
MTKAREPLDEAQLAVVTGGTRGTTASRIGGGVGEDDLSGTSGQDLISGSLGNDRIWAGAGNDIAGGGADDDRVLGSSGDDTLAGGLGHDTVDGGYDSDTIAWAIGDGNDSLLGGSNADGSAGFDTLRLEQTGLSTEQLIALIVPDTDSPAPKLVGGVIDVTGVTGSITIAGETIRFAEFERITLSETKQYVYGR